MRVPSLQPRRLYGYRRRLPLPPHIQRHIIGHTRDKEYQGTLVVDFYFISEQIFFARDLEGDAIYVLESINKLDYLSQGLPSVVVLEKYYIKLLMFLE